MSEPRDELSAVEREHARQVETAIHEALVAAGGWISFEHFMDLALYAPGLGYYSAGARKFGAGGDFTTAPEVSELFGAVVARQCAEVLAEVPGSILELGAGTGRLAVDVLRRLETLDRLPQHYWILELSADLRERQRQCIQRCSPGLESLVTWLDTPPRATFDGLILANEVLDALPVTRFRWHPSHCEELGVEAFDGGFRWSPRRGSEDLHTHVAARALAGGGWDDGYVSEYCPRLAAWTHAVTDSLRCGAVLWFDYGLPRAQYYLPERHEGTLIGHFRQRVTMDVLLRPGLQDISAWVDFTAVAEAGAGAGFDLAGFTTQAMFLAGLGIDTEMNRLAGDDAGRFAMLANQAKRLMLPGEMGERFKVMTWTRGLECALSGFALQDLRGSL